MSYEEDPHIQRRETVVATGSPVVQQRVAAESALIAPAPAIVEPPVAVVEAAVPAAPVYVAHEPIARGVRTDRVVRWAPDAVLAGIVGLVLLLIGLVAMTRAGLSGPIDEPVVEVAGFRHTALLGLVEAAFGLALMLSGTARSRSSAIFFGSVLGIAGFVAAVQTASFEQPLAIESSFAWIVTVVAAVVVVGALALPRVVRRSTFVDRV